MGGFLLLVFGLSFYFLPAFVGAKKQNATAIFWLNLLLGWTVLGWIVALIWATSHEAATQAAESTTAEPSVKSIAQELESLRQMKEAGHLSEMEYQQAKGRVLAGAR